MDPEELLKMAAQHEGQSKDNSPEGNGSQAGQNQAAIELNDDIVHGYFEKNEGSLFNYVSKKQGREIKGWDDFKQVEEREVVREVEKIVEKEIELPESVKSFFEFTKSTGRESLDDFIKAKKDWTKESEDYTVKEYLRNTTGLDGEDLDHLYELEYQPNKEDPEVTERTVRAAELKKKQVYREALKYFDKQKESLYIPSAEVKGAQAAAAAEQEGRRLFAEGILGAIDQVEDVAVDDFKFKVDGKDNLKSSLNSLEGILQTFKTKEGHTDYKRLVETLYAGMNKDAIAKGYADHKLNSKVEDDKKKMHNHNSNPTGSQGARISDAREMLNRLP